MFKELKKNKNILKRGLKKLPQIIKYTAKVGDVRYSVVFCGKYILIQPTFPFLYPDKALRSYLEHLLSKTILWDTINFFFLLVAHDIYYVLIRDPGFYVFKETGEYP